jgi:hypothetical protein
MLDESRWNISSSRSSQIFHPVSVTICAPGKGSEGRACDSLIVPGMKTISDQTWAGIRTEFTLPALAQVNRRLSELMEDPEPVMQQLVRVHRVDNRGRRPRAAGEVMDSAALFGQFRHGLGPEEELVGPEVLHGLDIQGFLQLQGIGLGHALKRTNRCLGQFLNALALVCLIELIAQTSHCAAP